MDIQLVPKQLQSLENGSKYNVFLLDRTKQYDEVDLSSEFTTIKLGDIERKLSSKVLSMMIKFENSPQERMKRSFLYHDCGVFALACSTGDSLSNINFGPTGELAYPDFVVNENDYKSEPNVSVGEVVFTANKLPGPDGFVEGTSIHFAVKASDSSDGRPLYVSKWGIGPVVAHYFEDSAMAYSAKVVGQAVNFKCVHTSDVKER